jgi:hypothetical protein
MDSQKVFKNKMDSQKVFKNKVKIFRKTMTQSDV